VVDNSALKKALQETMDCAQCKGTGSVASKDGGKVEDCAACAGTGTVAVVIPGARLARSEHLRLE
jgi:DnaJ-class molecular chaperone